MSATLEIGFSSGQRSTASRSSNEPDHTTNSSVEIAETSISPAKSLGSNASLNSVSLAFSLLLAPIRLSIDASVLRLSSSMYPIRDTASSAYMKQLARNRFISLFHRSGKLKCDIVAWHFLALRLFLAIKEAEGCSVGTVTHLERHPAYGRICRQPISARYVRAEAGRSSASMFIGKPTTKGGNHGEERVGCFRASAAG